MPEGHRRATARQNAVGVARGATLAIGHASEDLHRIRINYGFMREVDVRLRLPAVRLGPHGGPVRRAFCLDGAYAESSMDFFKLPTNRVVGLGSQLEI